MQYFLAGSRTQGGAAARHTARGPLDARRGPCGPNANFAPCVARGPTGGVLGGLWGHRQAAEGRLGGIQDVGWTQAGELGGAEGIRPQNGRSVTSEVIFVYLCI